MIYENVVRLCEERGITVSALEKELNLGNATVRGWKISDPRTSKLKSVADYFGCTVDDLLKEVEPDDS